MRLQWRIAWVIGALAGLQYCRLQSREMLDAPLISPFLFPLDLWRLWRSCSLALYKFDYNNNNNYYYYYLLPGAVRTFCPPWYATVRLQSFRTSAVDESKFGNVSTWRIAYEYMKDMCTCLEWHICLSVCLLCLFVCFTYFIWAMFAWIKYDGYLVGRRNHIYCLDQL